MQIANNKPDIMMISEVIPKAQTFPLPLALLSIPGYKLYVNFDPTQANLGRSGCRGVCIYVRDDLPSAEVSLHRSSTLEQLWITLSLLSGDQLLLGCVYLSPSGDRLQSILELHESLQAACNLNASHILIAGDFNVPQIDWTNTHSEEPSGHYSHKLIECLQDHFLTQHVTRPTRYRHGQTPNILDLILSNEEGMVRDLQHLPGLGCSDHVVLRFNLVCYTVRSSPRQTLNYNRGNYNLLRNLLREVDWAVMHEFNVHRAYHFFVSTLQEAVMRSIPVSRPKANKNMYLTKPAMKLKREKASLWRTYVRTKDPIDYARCCRCRNKLRNLTRQLRKEFELKLSKELKENQKLFWKYSNSRLKTKSGIECLRDEHGCFTHDDNMKASILNKFFASVFTEEDVSTIPQCTPPTTNPHVVDDLEITEDMVRTKLSMLKSTSSPGPDHIHPRVLKEAAGHLAKPLSILYNKSISEECLPEDWKLGVVVPIFKKGDRQGAENYRPISLTSIPCKVLESLIRDRLMSHMEDEELLSKHQHGFRARRSCSSQLIEVLDEWSACLESGEPVDTLYLDFRKAFDSVPHQRLLRKLEYYGITGKLKQWIAAFLSGRLQQVTIRGCCSPWVPVSSGVPQGSVLGPALFIIYINDLADVVCSSIKIFADDTKIYRSVSPNSGSEQLQRDLDAVVAWSDMWQLPFSDTKCKVLHLGSGNPCQPYTMRGAVLEVTPTERDLGIFVDPVLKFRKQAAAAASKGNQMLALVKRSFACINNVTLPLLYKSLVRPHLEYGNLVWGPFNRADQKLIERVQRRATKLVPELRHLPYQERLRRLNLPSLYHRRRRGDMITIFQIMNGGINMRPDQLFEPAVSAATRGHEMKLRKPQAASRARRNTLAVRAINDWNALPPSIILSASLNQFKSRLDKHWGAVSFDIPDQDQ